MDIVTQHYLEFCIRQDIHMYRAAIFSLHGKTPQALAVSLDKDRLVLYLFNFHLGKLEYPAERL